MGTEEKTKSVQIEIIISPVTNNEETFEYLLQSAGGFGVSQWYFLIVLLLSEIPASFVLFVPIFTLLQSCNDNEMRTNFSTLQPQSVAAQPWDLSCKNSLVLNTIISVQLFGMLLGFLFGYQISDWFGRKPAYLFVCIIMFLGQALSAMAPTPFFYAVARLFAGAGLSGFMGISTVYSNEFFTQKWCYLTGNVGTWGIGQMLLVLIAQNVSGWRQLTWICTVSFAFIVFTAPFVPESLRWLFRNKKIASAKQSLQSIARTNGVRNFTVTDDILHHIADSENNTSSISQISYVRLFAEPDLRYKTLVLMGIWFSWSIVYFGLSFNVKYLQSESPYWSMFLMGLSDAIGFPLALFINSRIGWRKSLVALMTLSSTFLTLLAVLNEVYGESLSSMVIGALCVFGKVGIAGTSYSALNLTSESYPTPVQTMGYGICVLFAGVGGILAPQIVFLGSIWWKSFPFLTFATVSVLGVFCSILLNEAAGKSLQETIINVLPVRVEPIHKCSKNVV